MQSLRQLLSFQLLSSHYFCWGKQDYQFNNALKTIKVMFVCFPLANPFGSAEKTIVSATN